MRGVKGTSDKYCKKHGIEKTSWHARPTTDSGGAWECHECIHESVVRNRGTAKQGRRKVVLVGDQQLTVGQARSLWTHYRLRPQDVYDLWEAQGRKCMFGGESLAWGSICIDHEHGYPGCSQYFHKPTQDFRDSHCPKESVRGVACRQHNQQQGVYEADPEGYMAIAKWHVKHNGGNWEDICS